MRKFVDDEIIPHVDEWEKANGIPRHVFKRAFEVGLLPAMVGWPEDVAGPRPTGFDGFFSMIAFDELSRCASGGVVWGLTGGFGIGLPPIVCAYLDIIWALPVPLFPALRHPHRCGTALYYLARGKGGFNWLINQRCIRPTALRHFADEELRKRVAVPVIRGDKCIALAVSEATAGSDVASLETTAVEDGDVFST